MKQPIKVKKTAQVLAGCVACGSCLRVCPRSAIAVPGGVTAVIDPAQCVGCGRCEVICPAGLIEMREALSPRQEKKEAVRYA